MAIHHIILLKYKPEATPEQKQVYRDSLSALPSKIPAIQSLITGETVSNRHSHGYDEGIIMVFENVAGLNEYVPNQAHRDHVALGRLYIEDILIFDVETAQ